MKRVLKSSLSDFDIKNNLLQFDNKHTITIDVNYSEIQGTVSKLLAVGVEEKFRTFISNILGALEQYDFQIEKYHLIDRENSASCYIMFYSTNENGTTIDKYIIFLRILKHDIDVYDSGRRYRFENVVVGRKSCSSYASALDLLYDLFEEMKKDTDWRRNGGINKEN